MEHEPQRQGHSLASVSDHHDASLRVFTLIQPGPNAFALEAQRADEHRIRGNAFAQMELEELRRHVSVPTGVHPAFRLPGQAFERQSPQTITRVSRIPAVQACRENQENHQDIRLVPPGVENAVPTLRDQIEARSERRQRHRQPTQPITPSSSTPSALLPAEGGVLTGSTKFFGKVRALVKRSRSNAAATNQNNAAGVESSSPSGSRVRRFVALSRSGTRRLSLPYRQERVTTTPGDSPNNTRRLTIGSWSFNNRRKSRDRSTAASNDHDDKSQISSVFNNTDNQDKTKPISHIDPMVLGTSLPPTPPAKDTPPEQKICIDSESEKYKQPQDLPGCTAVLDSHKRDETLQAQGLNEDSGDSTEKLWDWARSMGLAEFGLDYEKDDKRNRRTGVVFPCKDTANCTLSLPVGYVSPVTIKPSTYSAEDAESKSTIFDPIDLTDSPLYINKEAYETLCNPRSPLIDPKQKMRDIVGKDASPSPQAQHENDILLPLTFRAHPSDIPSPLRLRDRGTPPPAEFFQGRVNPHNNPPPPPAEFYRRHINPRNIPPPPFLLPSLRDMEITVPPLRPDRRRNSRAGARLPNIIENAPLLLPPRRGRREPTGPSTCHTNRPGIHAEDSTEPIPHHVRDLRDLSPRKISGLVRQMDGIVNAINMPSTAPVMTPTAFAAQLNRLRDELRQFASNDIAAGIDQWAKRLTKDAEEVISYQAELAHQSQQLRERGSPTHRSRVGMPPILDHDIGQYAGSDRADLGPKRVKHARLSTFDAAGKHGTPNVEEVITKLVDESQKMREVLQGLSNRVNTIEQNRTPNLDADAELLRLLNQVMRLFHRENPE